MFFDISSVSILFLDVVQVWNLNLQRSNEVLGMKIPHSLLENLNCAVMHRINKEIGFCIPRVLKLSICLLGCSIECFTLFINIISTFRNNNILKT